MEKEEKTVAVSDNWEISLRYNALKLYSNNNYKGKVRNCSENWKRCTMCLEIKSLCKIQSGKKTNTGQDCKLMFCKQMVKILEKRELFLRLSHDKQSATLMHKTGLYSLSEKNENSF